eukprot:6918688-Pyramimonas_sp.AAC.1
MGLEGLSQVNQEKVAIGNIMMLFYVSLLCERRRRQVPCSLGNPASSRLWLCPAVRWLPRARGVSIAATEFCQRGVAWEKSTRFLFFGLDLAELERARCAG